MKSPEFENYRQHLPAIRTWGEFVIVQHQRGTTMNGIREILLKNGLSEAAADAVFATAGTSFYRDEMRKKHTWRLLLGLFIIAFALFAAALEIKGKIWLWTLPIYIIVGFLQVGLYFHKVNE